MILFAALLSVLSAADLRVQVLTPFRLKALTIEAAQVTLGADRIVTNEPLTMRVERSQIALLNARGPRVLASGPSVVLHLPDGTRRAYRGSLGVTVSGSTLRAVVTMKLEDAVASVVDAEMPSAPAEARRAQAVAARSYYAASAGRHRDFDFCDTTHCQFLKGIPKDLSAAASTQSLVLMYEGRAFGAMYFRSCGGHTMTASDVGLDGSGYPYFNVTCEACRRNPDTWQLRLPLSLVERLNHKESERLEVARTFGWNSLRSNDYQSVHTGSEIEVRGKGHGHGVGMCQRGAASMAAAGHDFTAILRHYYPQANVTQNGKP